MKVADWFTHNEYVYGRDAGKAEVRLLDLLRDLGVHHHGLPHRLYYRDNLTIVTLSFGIDEPYYEVAMDLGANRLNDDAFEPRVVSREPVPYVLAWRDLFEYEPGVLSPWSKRRKPCPRAFPEAGYVLFEVLGRAKNGLRVRLPHKPGKEWILTQWWTWLDRRPSQLEIRLRELQLDNPFTDHQHTLYTAGWLMEYAMKERWGFTYGQDRVQRLAIETWEEERRHEGLGVDEMIIALKSGVLTEERADWGLMSPDLVARYVEADWGQKAPDEVLEQMTDLWLIERRMIITAIRTMDAARRMWARDTFDRLMKCEAN